MRYNEVIEWAQIVEWVEPITNRVVTMVIKLRLMMSNEKMKGLLIMSQTRGPIMMH